MRDCWEKADLDKLLDGMSRPAFMLRFTVSAPGASNICATTWPPTPDQSKATDSGRAGGYRELCCKDTQRLMPSARESTSRVSAAWRCEMAASVINDEPWNVPGYWCNSTGTPACNNRSP
jgi:hypothetical protein